MGMLYVTNRCPQVWECWPVYVTNMCPQVWECWPVYVTNMWPQVWECWPVLHPHHRAAGPAADHRWPRPPSTVPCCHPGPETRQVSHSGTSGQIGANLISWLKYTPNKQCCYSPANKLGECVYWSHFLTRLLVRYLSVCIIFNNFVQQTTSTSFLRLLLCNPS